jgi:hypothetical protein
MASSPTCTVTLGTIDKTVTAVFKKCGTPNYCLTVETSPAKAGTIISSDNTINYPSDTIECSDTDMIFYLSTFSIDTKKYTFDKWSNNVDSSTGSNCVITVTKNVKVIAFYKTLTPPSSICLTVKTEPVNVGTITGYITSNPSITVISYPSDTNDCSILDTKYTLTTNPINPATHTFDKWSTNIDSQIGNMCGVTLNVAKTIIAYYKVYTPPRTFYYSVSTWPFSECAQITNWLPPSDPTSVNFPDPTKSTDKFYSLETERHALQTVLLGKYQMDYVFDKWSDNVTNDLTFPDVHACAFYLTSNKNVVAHYKYRTCYTVQSSPAKVAVITNYGNGIDYPDGVTLPNNKACPNTPVGITLYTYPLPKYFYVENNYLFTKWTISSGTITDMGYDYTAMAKKSEFLFEKSVTITAHYAIPKNPGSCGFGLQGGSGKITRELYFPECVQCFFVYLDAYTVPDRVSVSADGNVFWDTGCVKGKHQSYCIPNTPGTKYVVRNFGDCSPSGATGFQYNVTCSYRQEFYSDCKTKIPTARSMGYFQKNKVIVYPVYDVGQFKNDTVYYTFPFSKLICSVKDSLLTGINNDVYYDEITYGSTITLTIESTDDEYESISWSNYYYYSKYNSDGIIDALQLLPGEDIKILEYNSSFTFNINHTMFHDDDRDDIILMVIFKKKVKYIDNI